VRDVVDLPDPAGRDGRGGSFGIVTALELRLFPITQLYAGILWYPIERGPEVLHAWRDLTRGAVPDELTTLGRFLRLPPVPDLPAEIGGKSSPSSRPSTSAVSSAATARITAHSGRCRRRT
jgi:hypothetical protein